MNSKSKASTYNGLSAEFRTVSRNLCCQTIPLSGWDNWAFAALADDGLTDDNRRDAILEQLDQMLFEALLPKDMAPPDRNMAPHIRGDLNPYRGWMLNRVLRQLHDLVMQKQVLHAYILPEDLPKIADDLFLYRKHLSARPINKLASLNDLSNAVRDYQPAYPLAHADRFRAFAEFLETPTPNDLAKLLPEGCRVTKKSVISADGQNRYHRRGGAEIKATLDDGTLLIQVKSKRANHALGSPRWCTTWLDRDHYTSYSDDLLMILNPSGERWQLHFRTQQFMDAHDLAFDLAAMLKERPDLIKPLTPFVIGWMRPIKFRLRNYSAQSHGPWLSHLLLNDSFLNTLIATGDNLTDLMWYHNSNRTVSLAALLKIAGVRKLDPTGFFTDRRIANEGGTDQDILHYAIRQRDIDVVREYLSKPTVVAHDAADFEKNEPSRLSVYALAVNHCIVIETYSKEQQARDLADSAAILRLITQHPKFDVNALADDWRNNLAYLVSRATWGDWTKQQNSLILDVTKDMLTRPELALDTVHQATINIKDVVLPEARELLLQAEQRLLASSSQPERGEDRPRPGTSGPIL